MHCVVGFERWIFVVWSVVSVYACGTGFVLRHPVFCWFVDIVWFLIRRECFVA